MNIRIYKTISEQEKLRYVIKLKDGLSAIVEKSIGEVARIAKIRLNNFLIKNRHEQATIDFSPFHDAEWISGLTPVRCFPLTEGEKQVFWLHFLKN